MLKKLMAWVRGLVRQEVVGEVQDTVQELRAEIRKAVYAGAYEARKEIEAAFQRQVRVALDEDELDAEFSVVGSNRVAKRLSHKPSRNGHVRSEA